MFRKALTLNFTGPALSGAASRSEDRVYPPVCKPYGPKPELEAKEVGMNARRDVKSK